jgi:thiol-disulfide isomerase/thioredoxin
MPNRLRGTARTRQLLVLVALLVGIVLVVRLVGRSEPGIDGPLRLAIFAAPRPLPPLAFNDSAGQGTDLHRLRGKVVLLNIWATWCAPCRKEMPSLDRLQQQLGGDGLEVVALSIDTGDAGLSVVRSFYVAMAIRHLSIYNDPSGSAGFQLSAPGVPTTLLLDREGRELGRISGPVTWDGPEAIALIRRHLAGTDG